MRSDPSLDELARRIRDGLLSPVDFLNSCLERIDALESRVQAWVVIDREGAEAAARALHEEARQGRVRGPLHGIPVGVKDIIHIRGLPTEAGSSILKGFRPEADATVVRRLREAGAILLGKTVTTEFACFDPAGTRNPWNLDHTPGGSSSGSAAAVACGMVPVALGTQTAGSIIRPAAYCGTVGFKPTFGRVSRDGVIPISHTLDHIGLFARSAADATFVAAALMGHDPADPFSSRRQSGEDLLAPGRVVSGPRVGLVDSWFMEAADDSLRRATEDAAARIEKGGGRIVPVRLPESFNDVHQNHRRIMYVEAAAYHESSFRRRPEAFGPRLRSIIEEGLLQPAVAYAEARRHQVVFKREMRAVFEDVDVLLMPGTPAPAPKGLASTGDPAFNVPWSYAGFPVIALPVGLAKGGLPVAVQLVGRPFADAELLAIARWCEGLFGFDAGPPF